ncbi:cytochrome P450 [Nocardia sp. GCM10030253]|uniref:cytochrome P450 n=1 Tax=Nocardia sp. GCM10030253 TaxID=3273404 RepID=UPI00362B1196
MTVATAICSSDSTMRGAVTTRFRLPTSGSNRLAVRATAAAAARAPVPGIPATLVIGYHTALRILNDPDHFPADPRGWQKNVPAECPILPMLGWRPNALRNAGLDHQRYRQANTAGIAEEALNTILGCTPGIGRKVATGMAAIFEGINAAEGNAMLTEGLLELVRLERDEPGADLATRLIEDPAALDDEEMIHQLVTLYGAGIEPQLNLIVNTLLLMMTDDRFADSVHGGTRSTRDALGEVLFTDPPLANYCVSYPRQPILIDGVWLPANQPVVISMAGCNNGPAIGSGEYTDNRSHLAWGLGPHACPAKSVAYLIVQEAIDQLLDALPELQLAAAVEDLVWRPGPFHRALASLPVFFPASPPLPVF